MASDKTNSVVLASCRLMLFRDEPVSGHSEVVADDLVIAHPSIDVPEVARQRWSFVVVMARLERRRRGFVVEQA
jgi:hypothetical protein